MTQREDLRARVAEIVLAAMDEASDWLPPTDTDAAPYIDKIIDLFPPWHPEVGTRVEWRGRYWWAGRTMNDQAPETQITPVDRPSWPTIWVPTSELEPIDE